MLDWFVGLWSYRKKKISYGGKERTLFYRISLRQTLISGSKVEVQVLYNLKDKKTRFSAFKVSVSVLNGEVVSIFLSGTLDKVSESWLQKLCSEIPSRQKLEEKINFYNRMGLREKAEDLIEEYACPGGRVFQKIISQLPIN